MKRIIVVLVAVLAAAALGIFEPWRAFTSSTLVEAVPATSSPPPTSPTPPSASAPATPTTAAASVRTLTSGTFVDAEHATDGSARIIELADGRRFLRLEGLRTSDGPDLHVWLSDARSGGRWGSYDDGSFVRLGKLKATRGSQNYLIPAGADLTTMKSAVIWCDRFNVAFGTAPLAA
ncbi:MAG: hypothetical protein JWQ74_965 [Marmoricola sp.]|nr:hypothetical protein [Marmoricola sp.]